MHLTDAQSERFYRVYYSLLEYANDTFDILGEFFEPFDEVTGPEQILDLSLFIFGGGDVDGGAEPDPAITEKIIDSYIAANPLHLGEADLRQVAQWKSALADVFHVMEHTAASSAFMLDGECLFNAIGLTRDVSAAVRNTPAIVRTVLLPFDNAIVYGTTIRDFNVEIGPNMLGRLQGEYAELKAKGPKATSADEFLREAPLCKQRAQAREEEDRAFLEEGLDTIDEPSQGMHRGVLAGLTPEEREAAVSAHYRQSSSPIDREIEEELSKDYIYCYGPERTLLNTLFMLSKKELCALAKHEHLRGYSKLSKKYKRCCGR
ncbi:MAG: hypothetical protein ACI36Y_03310 [Coriobacteriales bacterium]